MKYFLCLFLPLLCSSCLRYYYTSPTHQLPDFTKKGQSEASLGIHGPSSRYTAEGQYAWAFQKRLHISGSGLYANSEISDKSHGSSKHRYAEIGLGGCLPFHVSEKIRWKILVQSGVGLGRSGNEYAPVNDGLNAFRPKSFSQYGSVNIRFRKWYAQPGISFTYRKLSAIGSMRMGQLIFTKGTFVADREEVLELFMKFKSQSNFWLMEPAISLSYDIKHIKVRLQFGGNFMPRYLALETFGSTSILYQF